MKTCIQMDELLSEREWLKRVAYRMVRDRDEADDVVQETYLAAIDSPPPSGRPTRGWLGRVATNVVRMRYRSKTRRKGREQRSILSCSMPACAGPPGHPGRCPRAPQSWLLLWITSIDPLP